MSPLKSPMPTLLSLSTESPGTQRPSEHKRWPLVPPTEMGNQLPAATGLPASQLHGKHKERNKSPPLQITAWTKENQYTVTSHRLNAIKRSLQTNQKSICNSLLLTLLNPWHSAESTCASIILSHHFAQSLSLIHEEGFRLARFVHCISSSKPWTFSSGKV